MPLIKGQPDPKFIVKKTGQSDVAIIVKGYTDFDEDYEPEFLSHEIDDGELRRKLKWFRYRATIYFEKVEGENLVALSKLVDINAYDTILFYPNYIDKPFFFLDVTIDDETIRLAYFKLLSMSDFTLKLI